MGTISAEVRKIFKNYRKHKNHMRLAIDLSDFAMTGPFTWRVQRNAFWEAVYKQSIQTRCDKCREYTKIYYYFDRKQKFPLRSRFLCKPCIVLEKI